MAGTSTMGVACPACGIKYKWQTEVAGRKIKCKCGAILRLPQDPGGPAAIERPVGSAPAAAAASNKCPSCGGLIKSGAVICINCGFHLTAGKKLQTAVITAAAPAPGLAPGLAQGADVEDESAAPHPPSATPKVPAPPGGRLQERLQAAAKAAAAEEARKRREAWRMTFVDRYVPLILIGVGVGLLALDILLFPLLGVHGLMAQRPAWEIMTYAAVRHTTILVIQLPCLLLGIFLVAKIFGTSFGPFWKAMVKLLALGVISLGADACMDSVLSGVTEGLRVPGLEFIKFPVVFLTFWGTSAGLFALDFMETVVLYLIVGFLPIIAALLLVVMFGVTFG